MRLLAFVYSALLAVSAVNAVAVPGKEVAIPHRRDESEAKDLWKRKGGGGGGGKGGSGGGGSSSGGGSSGSGSSGSSSGGARGGSSGSNRGSGSSNAGGATKTGSGPPPAYGRGAYYGGGGQVPYRSGGISPLGLTPFFLVGGAVAFWPAWGLHPGYMYPYPHNHTYYNQTAAANQTRAVLCGCDPDVVCACEENNSTEFYQDIVGDGLNYNKSLIGVGDHEGVTKLLINGTLPNGTTAPGGDEDALGAAAGLRTLAQAAGIWPMVVAVCAAVFLA